MIDLRFASADDLQTIVAMVDEEFIHSRQRRLSLASRFPAIYTATNARNLYVATQRNEIVCAVATKRRRWALGNQELNLAMVGGVCTRPSHRGQGIASALLQYVEADLAATGVHVAVLWTRSPGFYTRLGWHAADKGLFGPVQQVHAPSVPIPTVTQPTAQVRQHIEQVRQQWAPERVLREPADYDSIPIPADCVRCHAVIKGDEWTAYTLVGQAGGAGYIYEAVGDPSDLPSLWSAMARSYGPLYANEVEGSHSVQWLQSNATVQWQPQALAMWKSIACTFRVDADAWHIPYFDRI